MPKLTEEQIAQGKAFFEAGDANGDGFITIDEAKAFLASQGREWDDKAKDINCPLPSLEKYKLIALNHLLSQQ
jgi:Ca2+-binding EF-hand superfamily protein